MASVDEDPLRLNADEAPPAVSIPSKPVAKQKKGSASRAAARGGFSPRRSKPQPDRQPEQIPCPVCGRVIRWRCNFARHMRLHDSGKMHACSQCDRLFRDPTELRLHVESGAHLAPAQKKVYTCATCGGQFPSQRTLLHHSHDRVGAFQCDICRGKFQTAVVLAIHRRRHFWRDLPRCRLCRATFAFVDHLARHIRNHASETPLPAR